MAYYILILTTRATRDCLPSFNGTIKRFDGFAVYILYDYSIFLASFSSFFIPSTSILGHSVHELENCMVHLWTPVEWLWCVQRELLIEPEPDLPVFCLLIRTRPHKFRDPTFWKNIFWFSRHYYFTGQPQKGIRERKQGPGSSPTRVSNMTQSHL